MTNKKSSEFTLVASEKRWDNELELWLNLRSIPFNLTKNIEPNNR